MNKAETIKILSVISSAYPSVEMKPERIELWQLCMRDVPFQDAQQILMNHINTSKYPPAIADFKQATQEVKEDPEIEARNIQIAHQEWVAAGHDPEEFIYEPKRLVLR
ncbi:hypothetical protein E0485_14635 [Paenibacillus albiflavus]|uniref:Uncharacterized protein n=1 Tax=Paenibacillus albiflavus TaxID=2545760 RepID=A0A4R4EAX4_9BACL|nr:replicative helicase loader/inhibitor [Paenibacillus albiflavus]TCZ76080.1 hypothetical protein E0485_14635 [Paenibacillus albiflavus]